jgi:hypothetical protein
MSTMLHRIEGTFLFPDVGNKKRCNMIIKEKKE